MQKIYTIITIIMVSLLPVLDLFGQEFQVTNTNITEVDNKLVIKYDLLNAKPSQKFKVHLVITNSSGNFISVDSISGDVGDNVSGGANKQIIWDYSAEKIVMQDDINIEVLADIIKSEIGLSKALLLSIVCPGLGMSFKEKGKPYWLMAIGGYGSLGASYILNKKANENYDAYLETVDESLNNDLLTKSQSQNQLSKTMQYTAIGIWSINLVWTFIKFKHDKPKTVGMSKKQNFYFYSMYDPSTKTSGLALKFTF